MKQVASTLTFHVAIIIGIQLNYAKTVCILTSCPTSSESKANTEIMKQNKYLLNNLLISVAVSGDGSLCFY